jgi:hypothetical protein
VKLREMRSGVCARHLRGSKRGAGRVGGRRGRETRRHARVRTRRSTARAGKAELTRQAHGAERERGTRGGNDSALANRARKTERESEWAKETGTDRSAPLGREREREGAREGELPLAARARGLAGLSGPTRLLSPSLFL